MHTSACTPVHPQAHTCTCSHAQACPQMPPIPGPESRLLPVLLSPPRQGSPACALPVVMAMLRLPGDGVGSPMLRRVAESSQGGLSCPCCPSFPPSACTLRCCLRDVLSLAAQSSQGAGPLVLGSSHHGAAAYRTRALAKDCPLVGHLHPIMGSHLLPAIQPRSKHCPVAGRTVTAWTPKCSLSPHSPWPSLWCQQPSASLEPTGACQPLHAGCTIMGFPVLTRVGTDPAGFHAEGTGGTPCHATPHHAVPCHGSQQGRAEVEAG